MSDQKLKTGKKIFDFLNKIKFFDMRKSDEQFKEWLQKISYDDFIGYTTRLNGMMRDIPIKERRVDGDGVTISAGMGGIDYLPPANDDKNYLMKEVFDNLRNISNNDDKALLIYYAIQAIHPFSDGNGRTGRLFYSLISEDGKNFAEKDLSELLDHDDNNQNESGKGRKLFEGKILKPGRAYYYIMRDVAKKVLGKELVNNYGRIFMAPDGRVLPRKTQEQLSADEFALIEEIFDDSGVYNFPFNAVTLIKFIKENPNLKNCQIESDFSISSNAVFEDFGKKMLTIDNEELLRQITGDDVRRIIDLHKKIKVEFVQVLIDVFVNPENHKIRKSESEDVSIKDNFRIR